MSQAPVGSPSLPAFHVHFSRKRDQHRSDIRHRPGRRALAGRIKPVRVRLLFRSDDDPELCAVQQSAWNNHRLQNSERQLPALKQVHTRRSPRSSGSLQLWSPVHAALLARWADVVSTSEHARYHEACVASASALRRRRLSLFHTGRLAHLEVVI